MTNSVTFPIALGCDGSTVDDSTSPTTGLDDGGHRERFIPALSNTIIACNTAVMAASVAAGAVLTTSTTSHTIGISPLSKTFTITAGVANLIVSNNVRIHSLANPANLMYGKITSYVGTTLTVQILSFEGSGTYSDWQIILAGVRGPAAAVDNTLVTGMLKGNGVNIINAVDGTDYMSPSSLEAQTNKIKSWVSTELTLTAASPGSTTSLSHVKVIALDSDRDLILFGGNALFGIVKNNTTDSLGTVTLIRNANIQSIFNCLKIATDKVLVFSTASTAIEAVCLSFSGTTITVNASATATASSTITICSQLITVNSSFVISFYTTAMRVMAMTVTGTTVAIGAETSTSITNSTNAIIAMGTVLVAIGSTSTPNLMARPFTVSGTTLTSGTDGTVASTTFLFATPFLTGGRVGVFSSDSVIKGNVLSLSGTVASFTSVQLYSNAAYTAPTILTIANQILVLLSSSSGSMIANVLTDSSGTAVAGTATTSYGGTTNCAIFSDYSNEILFSSGPASGAYLVSFGISGNNPTASIIGYTGEGLNGGAYYPSSRTDFTNTQVPYVLKSTNGCLSASQATATSIFYHYYNPTTKEVEPVRCARHSFGFKFALQNVYSRPSNNSAWAVMPTNTAQTKVKLERYWID